MSTIVCNCLLEQGVIGTSEDFRVSLYISQNPLKTWVILKPHCLPNHTKQVTDILN